jgi:hypothetical protein
MKVTLKLEGLSLDRSFAESAESATLQKLEIETELTEAEFLAYVNTLAQLLKNLGA